MHTHMSMIDKAFTAGDHITANCHATTDIYTAGGSDVHRTALCELDGYAWCLVEEPANVKTVRH